MIVKKQTEPDLPARAQLRHVRYHEAQRVHQMRCNREQPLALDQRLAHQSHLAVLEIPKSAMYQLRARRGGVCGEVRLLH